MNRDAALWKLMDAACNAEVEDEQLRQLDERLRGDRDACQQFAQFSRLHAALYYEVYQLEAEAAVATFMADLPAADPAPRRGAPLAPTRHVGWSRWLDYRAYPLAFSLLVAAVTSLSLLLTVAQLPIFHQPALQHAAPQKAAAAVAQLGRTWDAVWKSGHRVWSAGAAVRPGSVLWLERGRAEVAFGKGAVITLAGPTVLQVLGEQRGRLERGRLVGRVAPAARGFAVEVEDMEIIDLGTEFAIAHVPGQVTEVNVQQGAVEVRPRAGTPTASGSPWRVEAGEAVLIDHLGGRGAPRILPLDKEHPPLAHRWEDDTPRNAEAYSDAVLASQPIAYWRLDHAERDEVRDASGNGRPAAVGRFVKVGIHGLRAPGLESSNLAAAFPGRATPESRLRSDALQLGEQYSVEMWFRNTQHFGLRAVAGYIFSSGADGAPTNPGEHLGLGGNRIAPQRLFVYNGQELLSGKTLLTLGGWHYVALVREGDQVTVYLDGGTKPEISATLRRNAPPGLPVFVGGRNDSHLNFRGQIDEVAFYDRPLSAEEVQRHYQAALFMERADVARPNHAAPSPESFPLNRP